MMTISKQEEVELFDFLSRQPKFREWVNSKLAAETTVLVASTEIDHLRKAQGKAQLLNQMIELLDRAPEALRRKN